MRNSCTNRPLKLSFLHGLLQIYLTRYNVLISKLTGLVAVFFGQSNLAFYLISKERKNHHLHQYIQRLIRKKLYSINGSYSNHI